MLKKVAVVFCSIFFFGCLFPSVSLAHDGSGKDGKLSAVEKDSKYSKDFVSKLDALLTKYGAAVDSKKDAIKSEISELITSHIDEDIAYKKAKLERTQKSAADLQKKISDIEADRTKYTTDRVEYLTSEKGQAKIHKKKKQFDKKKSPKAKKAAKTIDN
jgi:hypothetical protein